MAKSKSDSSKSAVKTTKSTRVSTKRVVKEKKPVVKKNKKSVKTTPKETTPKETTPKETTPTETTPTETTPTETTPTETTPTSPIVHLSKDLLTKNDVLLQFDSIVNLLTNHISSMKKNKQHVTPKLLRELVKNVKIVKKNSSKLMKKNKTSKNVNPNSGFLKPVKFSKDIALFTGWGLNETKSRVDVTKYLCNYIKENNLQNPEDRRQIIVDDKLSKLLKYKPGKEKEPLTYYRLQSYLKPHLS
jgi:hypothetical protein